MKRLFLLLFCVCALWLFALFAFAEEAPALAQVEHVTSTLSDDTVVDASSDVHGVVSVNDDATTEVIASYEFALDSSEA